MAIKQKKSVSDKPKNRDQKVSRRTAGLNVVISIAAAAALLIIVNVISNKKNYRCDMEVFGRYGLSDSAEKILEQIDQPVRLTSIYTSTRSDRKPQEYLPRLRDMMEEIARQKDNVTVVNVTSDRAKAEVLGRLRRVLDEAASDHRAIIRGAQVLDGKQGQQYDTLTRQWAKYRPGGWLEQFALPKEIEAVMRAGKNDLREMTMKLRQDLSASLPDYPDMVRRVEVTLAELQGRLVGVSSRLRHLSTVPERAKKQRQVLTSAAAAVKSALAKASACIGRENSPLPQDSLKVLKSFAVDIRAVADSAQLAATQLDRFAGDGYVRYARSWRHKKVSLPRLYRRISGDINNIADQAEGLIRPATKVADRQRFITDARQVVPQYLAAAGRVQTAVNTLLDELTKLDKHTQKIFAQAKQDNYLQAQIKPLAELLEQASKVKPLPEHLNELIEKINQDNIVLIEIGDKTGVIGFDEVWPLKAGQQASPGDKDNQQDKRVFHGDSALCAKMLSMTAEPFAEVVLTFFEDIPERSLPYQQQRPMVGPIPSPLLRTVRERLEKANLEVTEWNLFRKPGRAKESKEGPPLPKRKDCPQVLLILPPPEPSPMPRGMPQQGSQWSDAEVEKVRKVISRRTPAIFLTGFLRPRYMAGMTMPARYGFGDYLRKDWGIDVRTALRVIQTKPDSRAPGKFKLEVVQWNFMPLSSFTDHVIGKPLQVRRMYWYNACPITAVSDSKTGAIIKDILAIPKGRNEVWAISDIEAFIEKVEQRDPLEADPDSGDLIPPFAVAVEATKQIENEQARIIVLAVGESFTDYYLQNPVFKLSEDGTIAPEPPPVADVDLLINSVYHLVGRDEYIGAGPAIVEPIKQIAPGTMLNVKIIFGLAWPILMFAIGVVVMIVRKR